MSALEVAGSPEPPPPPLPKGVCPKMSHAVAIPIPSQRFAPAGQQAVELRTQVLEVPCIRERCQCWQPGEYGLEGDCGLKSNPKKETGK